MKIRRAIGALAVALLTVGGAAGGAAANTDPQGSDPAVDERGVPRDDAAATGAPLPPSSTVTLVSGERVRLDVTPSGEQDVEVLTSADGKAKPDASTFVQFAWHGDEYVVPDRVVPYLGGTLDPRLFDVSYLVRAKLDDAHRKNVPVTVEETTRGAAGDLPGVRVQRTAGDKAQAAVDKSQAPGFGGMLADRWASSRAARSSVPAGRLAGIERISLAPPSGAPAPPASPFAEPTRAEGIPYRTLTVRVTDRDSDPGVALGFVQNVDDARLSRLLVTLEGEASFSVPQGTYSLAFSVLTAIPTTDAFETALTVKPEVRVASDTTVHLDARRAVPLRAELDTPADHNYRWEALRFTRTSATGGGTTVAGGEMLAMRLVAVTPNNNPGFGASRLLATPTPKVTRGTFGFEAATQLRMRDAQGRQTSAPSYFLHFPREGRIPSSLTYRVPERDLTTVRSRLYDSATGTCDQRQLSAGLTSTRWAGGLSLALPLASAQDRTDYWYTAEPGATSWSSAYTANDCVQRFRAPRTIAHGQRITEVWAKGPPVPSPAPSIVNKLSQMPNPPTNSVTVCPACRQDDIGMLYLMEGGDSDPAHFADLGLWNHRETHLRLFRDGELAFDSAGLDVGSVGPTGTLNPIKVPLPLLPDPAAYRLEWRHAGASHPDDANIETSWAFRSSRKDPKATFPETQTCSPDPSRRCSFLPLLFPVYDLALDHAGTARAGGSFDVAFSVTGQAYAPEPFGAHASVSVSYDDGETWRPAESGRATKAAGDGNAFGVTIEHPPLAETSGFVSLKIHAEDRAGNTVDQTVIRAYGLRD
ncbi:MAG: hypothetical protein GEV10_04780 [Streptosporangiales bacterium]|nr:hypothetical protein [Streptosporangiales bacterium]